MLRIQVSLKNVSLFWPFMLAATLLSSCSAEKSDTTETLASADKVPAPILVVKDKYKFSMYPEYQNEARSRLKFDIRDDGDHFVGGAQVFANLKAKDGHESTAAFKEDTLNQNYVADIPLKHHEDYVVKTRVSIDKQENNVYKPTFAFHCCDPIFESGDLGSNKRGGNP